MFLVCISSILFDIRCRSFMPILDVCLLEHSNSGEKKFRFDFRYRIDFFDSIRLGNLINLPLVH